MNILILSSKSPFHSAKLGLGFVEILQSLGHTVEFVTRYDYKDKPSWSYSIEREMAPRLSSVRSFKGLTERLFKLKYLIYFIKKIFFPKRFNKWATHFQLLNELKPNPAPDVIIKSLRSSKYDVIETLFIQDFISSFTLKKLYDHFKCPIIVNCVDMSPMTGGCFYFEECMGYKNECKNCPGAILPWNKAQRHKNYLLKKEFYSTSDCYFTGNKWMNEMFLKSKLFKKGQLIRSIPTLDGKIWDSTLGKIESRKELNLPNNTFLFLAGAQNIKDKRKGMNFLLDACTCLKSERPGFNFGLVLVGYNDSLPEKNYSFPIYKLGFVNSHQLAMAYASADCYVSPTISDAGPTMVNQAIMCGTPVIAFKVGTALECVITGKTGYLCDSIDYKELYKGMVYIIENMDKIPFHDQCAEYGKQYSKETKKLFFKEVLERVTKNKIKDS